jgi:hypothetical protein
MLSLRTASFKSSLPTITVDRTLAFRRSETKAAADYWAGLCGLRPMPSRGELKPNAMRGFLPYVSLVDVDPKTGIYTVGLQATHLREAFGDLTHRTFGELFPPKVAQRWRNCFNLVRETSQPVRLATQVSTQGKLWLQCEVFIAPLSAVPESPQLASLFWVFISWSREAEHDG